MEELTPLTEARSALCVPTRVARARPSQGQAVRSLTWACLDEPPLMRYPTRAGEGSEALS